MSQFLRRASTRGFPLDEDQNRPRLVFLKYDHPERFASVNSFFAKLTRFSASFAQRRDLDFRRRRTSLLQSLEFQPSTAFSPFGKAPANIQQGEMVQARFGLCVIIHSGSRDAFLHQTGLFAGKATPKPKCSAVVAGSGQRRQFRPVFGLNAGSGDDSRMAPHQ